MAVNPLPPQAYTKETLQKAYSWLLTQSASIKDMATTQDMLISLYLKAQRNGEASLETPSIQNFKQELKSLANMMGDLQTPATHTTTQTAAQTIASATPTSAHAAATIMQQQTAQAFHAPPNQMLSSASAHSSATTVTTTFTQSSPQTNWLQQLDPGSVAALHDVRQTLNLSSDYEALRALIALGYKQFKKM